MRFDDWIARSVAARKQAHHILATHERLPSQVVLREDLAKQLSGRLIDVQDYFREPIACVEQGFFRAVIVMAWAGHFHVCLESLFHKHEADIRVARPKWSSQGPTGTQGVVSGSTDSRCRQGRQVHREGSAESLAWPTLAKKPRRSPYALSA